MGYFGGFFQTLPGLSILVDGNIPLMLGPDSYFYAANLGVQADNAWRFGSDVSEYFSVEQWDETGEVWEPKYHHDGTDLVVDTGGIDVTSGDLTLADGDIVTSADDGFYLGNPTTAGTWRITRDGVNLVHQLYEDTSVEGEGENLEWVTKQTITP
jgi:hypothetical protein